MSKVSALYPALEIADNEPRGSVSGYKLVEAKGFNGETVFRRVRVAVEYGVTFDNAKVMANTFRQANEPNTTMARFTVEL